MRKAALGFTGVIAFLASPAAAQDFGGITLDMTGAQARELLSQRGTLSEKQIGNGIFLFQGDLTIHLCGEFVFGASRTENARAQQFIARASVAQRLYASSKPEIVFIGGADTNVSVIKLNWPLGNGKWHGVTFLASDASGMLTETVHYSLPGLKPLRCPSQ